MHALATRLFPICRSITGDGVRETLRAVAERIPIELHEVPSGTHVLDWTVPDEWSIRDAYVATTGGDRVVDFRESNLHVVGYSEPVRAEMTLDELRPRLHVHDDEADWIPYRTSYYSRTWGFCLSRSRLDALDEGPYEVVVDSTLAPGSLTYGECLLPGERGGRGAPDDPRLPSVARERQPLRDRAPDGARRRPGRPPASPVVSPPVRARHDRLDLWLARNEGRLARITAGLVMACVGAPGPPTYKRSRRGDALVDRAGAHVIGGRDDGRVLDFVPWGWDERQFNSPGFDLPVGCLTRSLEGEFAEYHSSADDLDLIRPELLELSLNTALEIVDVLENDRTYRNLSPKGEPQLGKRGLYRALGGSDPGVEQLAMLWVLNQSDGTRSLLEIAERSGLSFPDVRRAADALATAGLLAVCQ